MTKQTLTKEQIKKITGFQKNEITEYHIYSKLSKVIKNPENTKFLTKIGQNEKEHYEFWKKYSEKSVKPNRWKIFKFYWLSLSY